MRISFINLQYRFNVSNEFQFKEEAPVYIDTSFMTHTIVNTHNTLVSGIVK